jgi:hypothetical protein
MFNNLGINLYITFDDPEINSYVSVYANGLFESTSAVRVCCVGCEWRKKKTQADYETIPVPFLTVLRLLFGYTR